MAEQQRFIRRGTARYFWVPAIANPATGPTRAELTAGVDITSWIAGISGFMVTSTQIAAPDMGSRFAKTIPGEAQAGDSSFRLYEDLNDDEVETTFVRDTEGYIVILRKGDRAAGASTPTKPMETWPSRVSSFSPAHSVDMTPADATVNFAITGEPFTTQTAPALA